MSKSTRQHALVALLLAMAAGSAAAQAPAPATAPAPASAQSAVQLESLVGRIALYPDDLVAIILPAATNPLQVVQAERFLEKRKTDPKLALDENWDEPIKALVNYPEIIKSMSGDLDWMSSLGRAVVADQLAVLEAVQAFRRKTHTAGNLKTDSKQIVVIEKEVITIVPANPEVIYVPQYNPVTVVVYGGYSSWGYYPTPYPVYYYPYPPGAAFATGLIWGAAIASSWHGNNYVAHYGGNANININNVNVNNVNINKATVNNANINKSTVNNANVNKATANNANVNKSTVNSAAASSQMAAGGSSQWKSSAQAGQYGGQTRAEGGSFSGAGATGSGAFSSSASGRQTQMDSARGAASRGGGGGGRHR